MVCWALSGLSQKVGRPICSLSRVRRDCLPEMSKTVSQLGETGKHFVGPAAQVNVHEDPFRLKLPALTARVTVIVHGINAHSGAFFRRTALQSRPAPRGRLWRAVLRRKRPYRILYSTRPAVERFAATGPGGSF